MPCYKPLKGYRAKLPGPNGRRGIVFNRADGYSDLEMTIPCGRCIGCRLEYSRQWAVRIMHEASLYDSNLFITLTYSDEHLPEDGSLDKRHFQLFMKRLRKFKSGVRYFHCGEYGETTLRPHYHAILFNCSFKDRRLYKEQGNYRLFTSQTLDETWGLGFCNFGTVSFESAAYVARYVTKKVTGDLADDHYQGRQPEYATMSRRPGIGAVWMDRFDCDVYPNDYVVMRGKEMKAPKYYDRIKKEKQEKEFSRIRAKRLSAARENADDNTADRLKVKETVARARLETFGKRKI